MRTDYLSLVTASVFAIGMAAIVAYVLISSKRARNQTIPYKGTSSSVDLPFPLSDADSRQFLENLIRQDISTSANPWYLAIIDKEGIRGLVGEGGGLERGKLWVFISKSRSLSTANPEEIPLLAIEEKANA